MNKGNGEISYFDRFYRIIGTSSSVHQTTSDTVNFVSALRGRKLVSKYSTRKYHRITRAVTTYSLRDKMMESTKYFNHTYIDNLTESIP